jgi:hypothetical protein
MRKKILVKEAGIIDFKYEEKKFVLLEAFEFTNESYELKKDKF